MPNQHVKIVKVKQPDEQHRWDDCTLEACGICQELVQLEKEVSIAQETVRILTQRRFTLKSSRNAIHDHLTSRLPIEIISEIFICHENFNNPEYNNNLLKRRIYGPTVLSSVCRRWREICLSLPNLWTNVYINLWREPVQFAEEWLKRSGALPLFLTIHAHKDRRGSQPLEGRSSTSDSICKVLRSHSARWQYLNFEETPANSLHVLFKKLEIMPESASFHLRTGSYPQDASVIRLNSPLRPGRVFIENVDIYKVIPMEWNNLTHIELGSHPLGQVLDLIRAAPKLRRCDSHKMVHSFGNPARPVEHKFLEELDLSFGSPCTDFFPNITFPCLRHLKYDSGPSSRRPWRQFPSDLKDFLVRSKLYDPPSLQTFTLRYRTPPHMVHDIKWLFEVTTVTHLRIDPRIGVERLFHKLSQDGSVFPYLQELKFDLFPRSANHEITPTMQPGPLAALGDFVAKHNSCARSAAAADAELDTAISSHQEVSDHSLLNDTPIFHQNDVGSIPLQYRRSFKNISIKMYSPHPGETNFIELRKDTLLLLQEAHKSGPLKVNIVNYSKGREVDVLTDPRCLKVDVSGEDYVVLQAMP